MKEIGITLLAAALLCSGAVGFVSAEQGEKQAEILFTHDLHSHLLPTYGDGGREQAEYGGFARLKTAIDQQKTFYPNALLLDGGDFSMGTLFQTVYREQAAELRMLGALGYDATTLGNHEFDYHGTGLAEMLKSAGESGDRLPAILCSNLLWTDQPAEDERAVRRALSDYPDQTGQDVHYFSKGGVKIAVFGIFGKDAELCAPMSGLRFQDPVETAKRTVERIKEQGLADLIICLSHSGTWENPKLSEDEILAKEVPGIDLIISGHTHTTLEQPIIAGDTIIASSGEYGKNLGSIGLVQKADGRWKLKEYTLHPIDHTLYEDQEIADRIISFQEIVQKDFLDRYGMEFHQVLAYAPFSFTAVTDLPKKQSEEPFGSLIADSYIHAVKQAEGDSYEKVDAAIVPVGVIRETFSKGTITVSDVFDVSSLGMGADGIAGYPLLSIYLTGEDLKTVSEIDASVSPFMETAQLYTAGLYYKFNPNRLILNKVTDIKLERNPGVYETLDDKKLYRVVSGLYSAQMLGAVKEKSFGLLSVTLRDKAGEPITDFNSHIIYGKQGELKEWLALAGYLQSFDQQQGVPVIPEYYEQAHGRKVVDHSKELPDLLGKPNRFAALFVGIPAGLLALAVTGIVFWKRRGRRKGGRAE